MEEEKKFGYSSKVLKFICVLNDKNCTVLGPNRTLFLFQDQDYALYLADSSKFEKGFKVDSCVNLKHAEIYNITVAKGCPRWMLSNALNELAITHNSFNSKHIVSSMANIRSKSVNFIVNFESEERLGLGTTQTPTIINAQFDKVVSYLTYFRGNYDDGNMLKLSKKDFKKIVKTLTLKEFVNQYSEFLKFYSDLQKEICEKAFVAQNNVLCVKIGIGYDSYFAINDIKKPTDDLAIIYQAT